MGLACISFTLVLYTPEPPAPSQLADVLKLEPALLEAPRLLHEPRGRLVRRGLYFVADDAVAGIQYRDASAGPSADYCEFFVQEFLGLMFTVSHHLLYELRVAV